MCTAISFKAKEHYFGRTLDIDKSYGEEVCVMPRNFPLAFRKMGEIKSHFAIIGMAAVADGLPLYYDAANEHGLAMAGLNFPYNAFYNEEKDGEDNIAPFEFIPWVLSQCKTVMDAKILLGKINLINMPFSESLPVAALHWIISDSSSSLVAEARKDGFHLHDNSAGVLTNNPPFEYQMTNLKKYKNLKTDNSDVVFEVDPSYSPYCQGLGAVGLPGDVSSMSRFVRADFNLKNSVRPDDEESSVSQYFHILSSVEMVKGACVTDTGSLDYTLYTSCINTNRGIYYYTTYNNRQITSVDMHKTDLDGEKISRYPLLLKENILNQN